MAAAAASPDCVALVDCVQIALLLLLLLDSRRAPTPISIPIRSDSNRALLQANCD